LNFFNAKGDFEEGYCRTIYPAIFKLLSSTPNNWHQTVTMSPTTHWYKNK